MTNDEYINWKRSMEKMCRSQNCGNELQPSFDLICQPAGQMAATSGQMATTAAQMAPPSLCKRNNTGGESSPLGRSTALVKGDNSIFFSILF